MCQTIADNVLERTDGKFQIEHFFGGSLGIDYGKHPIVCSEGVVQLTTISTGHSSGILPWIGVFQRPLLASWPDQLYNLGNHLLPIMERELGKMDITPIAFYCGDATVLWTVEPVDDVTNIGGRKIRCWDEASATIAEALGATPIIMSIYEVLLALQRGVVEGLFTGHAAIPSNSLQDVIRHGYLVDLPSNTYYVAYNNEAFNELPKEYQEILVEVAKAETQRQWDEAWETLEVTDAEILASGIEIHKVSDEDKRTIAEGLKPQWEKWADDGGPVARELLDEAYDFLGY